MILAHHTSAKILYEIDTIRPDGSERRVCRAHNLLMDAGIDGVLSSQYSSFTNLLSGFRLGTSNAPLRRDSGAITFTRAGNTVTASAAFFLAADSGRVLVVAGDGGAEQRITGYTSETVVTVSGVARDYAAASGTVLYVEQTALAAPGPLALFTEVAAGTDRNGYAFDAVAGTVTTWVSRISAAAAADTLYREIGWFNADGTVMLGRALINSGVGDTLLVGERYRVKVSAVRKFGPLSPTAAADLGVTGISGVTAQWQLEGLPLDVFNAAGEREATSYGSFLGNANYGHVDLSTNTGAFLAPTITPSEPVSVVVGVDTSRGWGGAKTGIVNHYATFAANTAAFSGVRSIYLRGSGYGKTVLRGLLSAPIGKTLEEQLNLQFRFTFGRDNSAI